MDNVCDRRLFFIPSKSTLFNEGDTQQSSTDKPVALEFPIDLEFRNDEPSFFRQSFAFVRLTPIISFKKSGW